MLTANPAGSDDLNVTRKPVPAITEDQAAISEKDLRVCSTGRLRFGALKRHGAVVEEAVAEEAVEPPPGPPEPPPGPSEPNI